jgi:hypothetical protein
MAPGHPKISVAKCIGSGCKLIGTRLNGKGIITCEPTAYTKERQKHKAIFFKKCVDKSFFIINVREVVLFTMRNSYFEN